MKEQGLYSYDIDELICIAYKYLSIMYSRLNILLSYIFSTIVSSFYGSVYLVELYLIFSVLDFILGVYIAVSSRHFSVKKSYRWVIKLFTGLSTIYLINILLNAIELTFCLPNNTTVIITNMVIMLLVLTETTAIISKTNTLGLPVPIVVSNIVIKLSKRIENKLNKAIEEDNNDDK